jgi:hypothetical protein
MLGFSFVMKLLAGKLPDYIGMEYRGLGGVIVLRARRL